MRPSKPLDEHRVQAFEKRHPTSKEENQSIGMESSSQYDLRQNDGLNREDWKALQNLSYLDVLA